MLPTIVSRRTNPNAGLRITLEEWVEAENAGEERSSVMLFDSRPVWRAISDRPYLDAQSLITNEREPLVPI